MPADFEMAPKSRWEAQAAEREAQPDAAKQPQSRQDVRDEAIAATKEKLERLRSGALPVYSIDGETPEEVRAEIEAAPADMQERAERERE